MTVQSLQEAERIGKLLLEGVEQARPILKEMHQLSRELTELQQRIKANVAWLVEEQAEVKASRELIERLSRKNETSMQQLVDLCQSVKDAERSIIEQRQQLERKYNLGN